MVSNLYTLGYESAALEDFISTLKTAHIDVIIDVRELPLSRRKGFSKNILKATLAEHGIEYIHLKGLGDPKEGRDAAKAGNMTKFLSVFSAHMRSDRAQSDLKVAIGVATNKNACLLCFERNHEHCHRTIVAEAIVRETKQKIRPIGVPKGIASSCDLKTITPMRDYAITLA